MVLTYIKKIRHSMLCVTGVYLGDITDMTFSVLHWNVNHLSICCSSCFQQWPCFIMCWVSVLLIPSTRTLWRPMFLDLSLCEYGILYSWTCHALVQNHFVVETTISKIQLLLNVFHKMYKSWAKFYRQSLGVGKLSEFWVTKNNFFLFTGFCSYQSG